MYSPLLDHSKAGDRIGVVGIGGLGHLAVKFARTRGCHVTALSSSEDKRESVLGMGANSFINTSDPAQVKRATNSMVRWQSLVYTHPTHIVHDGLTGGALHTRRRT